MKKVWKIGLVFILLGLLAACGHKAGNTAENKNANGNATVSNNKNVSTEEKENSPEAEEETQEDASAVDLENNFIDYKDGTFTGENVVGFEKS